jgi:hypothetical protein
MGARVRRDLAVATPRRHHRDGAVDRDRATARVRRRHRARAAGQRLRHRGDRAIYRLDDRDELVPPFDEDPVLDPETREVWMLRDRTKRHPSTGRFVMSGDELRAGPRGDRVAATRG